jgi:hypothetical protein
MYLQKKKSEKNIHAHNSRERMFEDEEKNQVASLSLSLSQAPRISPHFISDGKI